MLGARPCPPSPRIEASQPARDCLRNSDRRATYTLYAVTVASTMLSAATYVVTYQMPRPPDRVVEQIMEQKAHDMLE